MPAPPAACAGRRKEQAARFLSTGEGSSFGQKQRGDGKKAGVYIHFASWTDSAASGVAGAAALFLRLALNSHNLAEASREDV